MGKKERLARPVLTIAEWLKNGVPANFFMYYSFPGSIHLR
jgi:hypothetical protein